MTLSTRQRGAWGETVDFQSTCGESPGLEPGEGTRSWGGVAVGNGIIFLTEGNNILQMPITGGTPTLLVSDVQFTTLQGITFFNNALYVADTGGAGPGKIWKITLWKLR